MICRAKPYEGSEPFVFFSYCRDDANAIYPLLEDLARKGVRVWFDDGSRPEKADEIAAERIRECALCIAAISPAYFQTHTCRNELNYVYGKKTPLIFIQFSEFPMSVGFRLSLDEGTRIIKDECPGEQLCESLLSDKRVKACQGILPFIDEEATYGKTVYKKDKTAVLFSLRDNSLILLQKNSISIGRSEDSDLRIHSSEVGSKHAEILHSLGSYYIRDNHSRNGTFVNGVQVAGARPEKLTDGAVLSFSDEKYIFAEGNTAKFVMSHPACSYLMCMETEDIQILGSQKLLLGRLNQWPRGTFSAASASRVHGEISFQSEHFILSVPEHIGHPRTAVNGKRVAEGETAELKDADEIEIGSGLYHILLETKTITERRSI